MKRIIGLLILTLAFSVSIYANGEQDSVSANGEKAVVELSAASMFDLDHPFTMTLKKFEELVNEYQDEVDIVLKYNLNKSLGVESDYFRFMSQGESVDIAILAPAHLAQRVPNIAIVDMPLLFKNVEHRNKVLESDLFNSINEELVKKAHIRALGYAGGASRSIISNYPITNMEELQGFKIRVQGAPIWAKVFDAVGAAPSVIAYDEVYSAIQTGVIQGLENEKIGYAQMRFFEVAPHYTVDEHSITVRPLFISEKTFQKFSPTVREAILKAGKEAGEYGSQAELRMADEALDSLIEKQLAHKHIFSDSDQAEFRKRAMPVLMEYVEEAGFVELYNKIQEIQ